QREHGVLTVRGERTGTRGRQFGDSVLTVGQLGPSVVDVMLFRRGSHALILAGEFGACYRRSLIWRGCPRPRPLPTPPRTPSPAGWQVDATRIWPPHCAPVPISWCRHRRA